MLSVWEASENMGRDFLLACSADLGEGRRGLRYCGIGLFLVRCCGNFYFKVRYCGFQSPSGVP